MRPPRPRFGNGFTPTSSLAPCTCPTCQEELEITCPNRCANAADGARAERPAALRTHTPRVPWTPRERKPRGSKRQVGGTRDKVLAALIAGPLQVKELAARLDEPVGVVDAMCRILWKEGAVMRLYPINRKRPMSIALSTRDFHWAAADGALVASTGQVGSFTRVP